MDEKEEKYFKNFDKKEFNRTRDLLLRDIYRNLEYDEKEESVIIIVKPGVIRINIQIENNGFLDNYGYALYVDKGLSLLDLDKDVIFERINSVVNKITELNKENILEKI